MHDTDAAEDRRRLVLEQEFAQVLKVLSREGNTLSPIVRQAWDGDALQTMVRNNPLRASAAHVGIVGHITKDELLRYLTATELANGFQNRFLLIAVDRSKLLPFGSALDAGQLAEVRDAVRLGAAVRREHRALRARTRRPRAMDRDLPAPVGRPAGTGRRGDRARGGARRPPRADLRAAGLLGHDRARAPRGRARGLALQRRLRCLDLRRQPRRPHRRRDLGRRQGTPRWRHAHRGVGHVQPLCGAPHNGCFVPGPVMCPRGGGGR